MSDNKRIKVLVVDDSVLVRKYVCQVLGSFEEVEIVGVAPNGKIALQKIILYKPDIVILDNEMPEMTGLELLKYLKENGESINKPVIIMFSSLLKEGNAVTFEALNYGAADIISKPEGNLRENLEYLRSEFYFKIMGLYQDKKEKKSIDLTLPAALLPEKNIPEYNVLRGLTNLSLVLQKKPIKPELIAIGSSTGGPAAIRIILDNIGNLNIPVIIAQHMPRGFTQEFAKNLNSIYKRDIFEISPDSVLENGSIYICPGGVHSRLTRVNGSLVYQSDSTNYEGLYFRPSVDIFFNSIIQTVGKNVIGIILSGMGKDGSNASVNLRKKGAIMIAQDEESSAIWGMPGNSVKNGGIDIILDINEIGKAINIITAYSR